MDSTGICSPQLASSSGSSSKTESPDVPIAGDADPLPPQEHVAASAEESNDQSSDTKSANDSSAATQQSPRKQSTGDSGSPNVKSPNKKDQNVVAEIVKEMGRPSPMEIEAKLRRWSNRHRSDRKIPKFDVDGFNRWKRRMGLAVEQKVFIVDNVFPDFKQELLDRGWVENTWDPDGPWFDLKWKIRKTDVDYDSLSPPQLVNHFQKTGEITTKAGLNRHLKEASDLNEYDVDSWYPKTYHLIGPDEISQFISDFKIHKAEGILKEWIMQKNSRNPPSETIPEDVVRTALSTAKRRLVDIDALLDEEENEAVLNSWWITDDEWAVLNEVDFEKPGQENLSMQRLKEEYHENERMKEVRQAQQEESLKRRQAELQKIAEKFQEKERKKAVHSYKKYRTNSLQKQLWPSKSSVDAGASLSPATSVPASSSTASLSKSSGSYSGPSSATKGGFPGAGEPLDSGELLIAVKDVIENLKKKFPQFSLAGSRNTWVLKPHARARGEGVFLSTDLDEITSWCDKQKMHGSWMCQKYLENPFLVDGRKNDIRQWVIITCWNPLTIHFFSRSYIRMAADQFSLSDIKNNMGHVSNNNVTEHHPDYDADDDHFCFAMHDHEYRTAMQERYGYDAYTEKVVPAMKQIVIQSLSIFQECLCESTGVACSFEMLGFDFMVDDDLGVWLIEINSSPSMKYATPVHRLLVPQVMRDSARVVLGENSEMNYSEPKDPERGYFECILECGDVFSSHKTSDALSGLRVQGQQLLPPEPEKPEVQLVDEDTMRARRESELQILADKLRLKREKEQKKVARKERILKKLRKEAANQFRAMTKARNSDDKPDSQEPDLSGESGDVNDVGAAHEIECGKPSDALEALLLSGKPCLTSLDMPANPIDMVKAGSLIHLPALQPNNSGTPVPSSSSSLPSPKRFLQEQGAAIVSTSSSR